MKASKPSLVNLTFRTTMESKKQEKNVTAIVHAGHGVSYASGTEAEIIIATRACKEAKKTWSRMYKFPKETILIALVFDVTNSEKWNWNDDAGLMTDQDGNRLPLLNRYQVVV